MPGLLVAAGVSAIVIGYVEPSLIGRGARPYAYLSVMAVGAMLVIDGIMLWRDS